MDAKTILSRMFVAFAVLMLACCGPNDNPVRTSLDVETSNLIMSVGQSVDRPATTNSTDFSIVYSSTNPSVATVNQNGTVTALSTGRAIIKVYMPETQRGDYTTVSREYHVLVKNVSAVELKNVDKATPLTLVAVEDGIITVTFNGGITLSNDIHYTINAGDELTISKNTSGAFDIEVKKGDVVVLYSLNNSLGGSSVAAARAVTRAVDSGAKYINIKPSMKTEIYGNVMSLLKGKDAFADANAIEAKNTFYGLFAGAEKLVNNTERRLVLPATVLPEDATDPTVTWTSSNPSIATVTALGNKGTVHGVSNGEVTITALAGDKTATCKVTVITKEEHLFIEDTDEVESED